MRVRPAWRPPPPGLAPRCPCHRAHALIRVLLCRAHPGHLLCTRRWLAQGPAAHAAADLERITHEALCPTGLYTAAGL
ncbi:MULTISPECIES: hypothetical protein [Streptomyces]|uniref:Uncharacterized protein n=1 Tax=Streptomyces doudnae TaxID=3075536 RepID=A0ABD5ELW7_9ACTN|nr:MULTISPECIES: hypothetical protein [unclassified Streptomyces]MDT0435613.1 hypothetical protein [Streptomyces sp. DSM 41981]MYQ62568.1 hypothetical protein [Streptomyces sp. SID4950]SCD40071.1 hypothetical protein GA0115242_104872 [Streptomyces sp. SolWspMP-5a-2]